MKNPNGPQEIVIAGRTLKWDLATITYAQIVAEWNRLSPSRTILKQAGIQWHNEYEKGEGILYPGESIKVVDGLVITVDPTHLS